MGGVFGDADMGDVGFKDCKEVGGLGGQRERGRRRRQGEGGKNNARELSMSFLLKQLSIMRRFSASNRAALASMAACDGRRSDGWE